MEHLVHPMLAILKCMYNMYFSVFVSQSFLSFVSVSVYLIVLCISLDSCDWWRIQQIKTISMIYRWALTHVQCAPSQLATYRQDQDLDD